MTPRARAAVAEMREAAEILDKEGPLPAALATVLRAQAAYWEMWFPSEPSTLDRALVNLVRLVHETHNGTKSGRIGPNPPQSPDAGAGTRQLESPKQKG